MKKQALLSAILMMALFVRNNHFSSASGGIRDSISVFIEPTRSPSQVTLFPNPAQTRVYVSWLNASADMNRSLIIYDLRGQFVLSKQMVNETTGIDVSGMKPGVYFVRFSNVRMTRVLKFIKN